MFACKISSFHPRHKWVQTNIKFEGEYICVDLDSIIFYNVRHLRTWESTYMLSLLIKYVFFLHTFSQTVILHTDQCYYKPGTLSSFLTAVISFFIQATCRGVSPLGFLFIAMFISLSWALQNVLFLIASVQELYMQQAWAC